MKYFIAVTALCCLLALGMTGSIPVRPGADSMLSDETVTVTPRLILDLGRRWWTVATNVGYRFRTSKDDGSPILENDMADEVTLNLGVKFRPAYAHELMLDAQARTPATEFFQNKSDNYGEFVLAYRFMWGSYSTYGFTIGAGGGFMEGAGTPTVRVFLGFTAFEHRAEPGW